MADTGQDTETQPTARPGPASPQVTERRLRLAVPVLLLVVVALFLNFAFLTYGGLTGDRLAHERETALVDNFKRVHEENLEATLTYLFTDDTAYEALQGDNATEWLRSYAYPPLNRLGVRSLFLFDRDLQLTTALTSEMLVGYRAFQPYEDIARSLVLRVRNKESQFFSREADGARIHRVTGFAHAQRLEYGVVDGRVVLITASLVQPSLKPKNDPNRQSAIVVTVTDLNTDFTARFSRDLSISNFEILPGEVSDQNRLAAPFFNTRGEVIATSVWRLWRPGSELLVVLLPVLSLVALAVLGAALFFLRKTRQMAAELVNSEQRAIDASLHDALTGLANRALFTDRLDHAIQSSRRSPAQIAVHLVDLDRFKEVNDTLGHQAGDDLIRTTGERLAKVCRSIDTVARLGGDEFAIIQPGVNRPDDAARLSRRVLEALSVPFEIGGAKLHISGSVGVALSLDDSTQEELLRQADIALYKAKNAGRNTHCFFETEMDASLRAKKAMEADLREALEEELLTVAFQPQFCSVSGEISGIETLVRWNHPVRGVVPPSYFVPIAEECGLIRKLGRYVLRKALHAAQEFPHARVSINVSAAELSLQNYAEKALELAREFRVPPQQLEIEVPEEVMSAGSERVMKTLSELRYAGFTVALDDFGTGYSSLIFLKNFPVDKLKIDRSFIAGIGYGDENDQVVEAIIRLGKAMDLVVSAEGVETAAQRSALVKAGCVEMQGYLFSKPMAIEDIRAAFPPEADVDVVDLDILDGTPAEQLRRLEEET